MKMRNLSKSFKIFGNTLKDHKLEIATGVSIAMEAASVVMTAKATVKLTRKTDELKDKLDAMHDELDELKALVEEPAYNEDGEAITPPSIDIVYEEDRMKKEEKLLMREYGWYAIKQYALPFVLFVGGAVLQCFTIRSAKKQIGSLIGEITALTTAHNLEKERAKKILSEEQYNELYYGLKKAGKTIEDENGNEVEVYENCLVDDNNFDAVVGPQKIAVSPHAIVLDEGSTEWDHHWAYMQTLIKNAERNSSDVVRHEGFIRLNEIRTYLGLKPKDEDEHLGVTFDPDKGYDQVCFEVFPMVQADELPRFVIDVNYECLDGKINDAIRRVMED